MVGFEILYGELYFKTLIISILYNIIIFSINFFKSIGNIYISIERIVTGFLCCIPCSYMILAPATMAAQSDPKVAAAKCFEEIGLDPDSYRIGHTKAS